MARDRRRRAGPRLARRFRAAPARPRPRRCRWPRRPASRGRPADADGLPRLGDRLRPHDLTFTYTANLVQDGTLTITVPPGWTPPSQTPGDGYTTVSCPQLILSAPACGLTVDPAAMTITVTNIYRDSDWGRTLTVDYTMATPPATAGTSTFNATEQDSSTPTPVTLPALPVAVNCPDGTGSIAVAPQQVTASQMRTLMFSYTAGGCGTQAGGLVELQVPNGWPAGGNVAWTGGGTAIDLRLDHYRAGRQPRARADGHPLLRPGPGPRDLAALRVHRRGTVLPGRDARAALRSADGHGDPGLRQSAGRRGDDRGQPPAGGSRAGEDADLHLHRARRRPGGFRGGDGPGARRVDGPVTHAGPGRLCQLERGRDIGIRPAHHGHRRRPGRRAAADHHVCGRHRPPAARPVHLRHLGADRTAPCGWPRWPSPRR